MQRSTHLQLMHMHLSFTSDNPTTLEGSNTFIAKKLIQSFKIENWPIRWEDLPVGTVLVGGAVRDALLNKQYSRPDFDFVVPNNAINTCKNLVEKYGGTAIELDCKRDIARYVINDWKIDIATQFGNN